MLFCNVILIPNTHVYTAHVYDICACMTQKQSRETQRKEKRETER